MEAIFWRLQEFLRLRSQPTMDPESGGQRRAAGDASGRFARVGRSEVHLSLLATTGSTSPSVCSARSGASAYAFRALGLARQATLAQVAPGIAEALVATAMGLFAPSPRYFLQSLRA